MMMSVSLTVEADAGCIVGESTPDGGMKVSKSTNVGLCSPVLLRNLL